MTLADFKKDYPASSLVFAVNADRPDTRIPPEDLSWASMLNWQCDLYADYSGTYPVFIPVVYDPSTHPTHVGRDLTNPKYSFDSVATHLVEGTH